MLDVQSCAIARSCIGKATAACHRMQKWNWDIARTWFPANLIFVGMLWSSFPALQLLGVGMVSSYHPHAEWIRLHISAAM